MYNLITIVLSLIRWGHFLNKFSMGSSSDKTFEGMIFSEGIMKIEFLNIREKIFLKKMKNLEINQ